MNRNKGQIRYGVHHTHTYYSLHDSALSAECLVETAAKLGAPAISLTDHGLVTGVEDFMSACKKHGIKGVPGVEVYFEEDDNLSIRTHLILLAKNDIGYKAINKIVTASNRRLKSGFPRVNLEILKKYAGPGSEGHDHVIATSACVGGVLAELLLKPFQVKNELEKVKVRQSKLSSPFASSYKEDLEKEKRLDALLIEKRKERDELNKLSKRSLVKKEKTLAALEGMEGYEEMKAELEKEKAEIAQAGEDLLVIREQIKLITKEVRKLKDKNKKAKEDHEQWLILEKEKKALEEATKTEFHWREEAKKRALEFEALFGKGNFYIELQYHGIDIEFTVMPQLALIAEELDIPLVAANDVHTATNSEVDLKSRQIMRSLRFNKWEERNVGDDQLYVKTDEELEKSLSQILRPETVKKAMDGIGEMFSKCNVEIKQENHYPIFKSEIKGEDAVARLRRLCIEGIEWRYPKREGWTKEHEERMEYELSIITELGFCDYLCIVEDFLRYGRKLGTANEEGVGLGVGPGRGSAAGSLVCYLTGITGIDPMKYGLIFERFLNKERVSMPDIDSDFKTDIRDTVIEYVEEKYGRDAVCSIMTRGTQAVKGSIRNCARLLGSEKYGDTKVFLSLGDQICKSVPGDIGIKFSDCIDVLEEKYKDNPNAMEILKNAQLVEGTVTNYGLHAAGIIISDNDDISDYVALMYDTKRGRWKTQLDMIQAEEKGLLKMDFLGLKNLDIITETLRLVKRRTGKSIDIEKIPIEREVITNIYAKGYTNSVFQFESGGMKQMLKEFQPETIDDIILLVAAYRPGPMQFLPEIIATKHGKMKPNYVIPEMDTVLGVTYGKPIYQEQVMEIFNKFAGFSLGESDIIRRYMSKKKIDKFMAYKDKFIDGLIDHGAKKEDAEKFWEELVEFSRYAFNKSHACAYAFVSYYTAYLKHHYPTEYLCAVMSMTPLEKIPSVMADCKRLGIQILPPDVNESGVGFTIKNKAIIFGLGGVKNVGAGAEAIIEARKDGKFTSFADFVYRGHVKKDVTESLIMAGALDQFHSNRKAMLLALPEYTKILKKIKDKKKVIEEENKSDNPNVKRIKRAERALLMYEEDFSNEEIPEGIAENTTIRLEEEKELLGVYVSAHPLDNYPEPKLMDAIPIDELVPAYSTKIFGVIDEVRYANRKSDGAQMAFFTLEDITGTIEVSCFTEAYKRCGDKIKPGNIVRVTGRCNEEEVFGDDTETELKIVLKEIEVAKPMKAPVRILVNSMVEWAEQIHEVIKPYICADGHPIIIHDMMMNEIRRTNLLINEDGVELFKRKSYV